MSGRMVNGAVGMEEGSGVAEGGLEGEVEEMLGVLIVLTGLGGLWWAFGGEEFMEGEIRTKVEAKAIDGL